MEACCDAGCEDARGRKPRARGPRPAPAASTPNQHPGCEAVMQLKRTFLSTVEDKTVAQLYAVEGDLCDTHIDLSRVLRVVTYATMLSSALAP
jgi:hypothetical protein